MAFGAVVDRTCLFPLMAADAEFMAGFPVEFDVPGRAIMTVGAGELVTVEPMVENHIAVKCFVGESRNADSPSEKQKHEDVESFHALVPFGAADQNSAYNSVKLDSLSRQSVYTSAEISILPEPYQLRIWLPLLLITDTIAFL